MSTDLDALIYELQGECACEGGADGTERCMNCAAIAALTDLRRQVTEKDANIAAAENRIAALCEAHEEQFIRADIAEQRLRHVQAETTAVKDLLHECKEARFYGVHADDLYKRLSAVFASESREESEARSGRRAQAAREGTSTG